MAVSVYTESKAAEEIWLMLTGGSTESEPTLGEVQLMVDYVADYVTKGDYYEKYKLDNQHKVGQTFIVRYRNVALSAYDSVSKSVLLPAKVIDFPRDRGLDMITWNATGKPEQRIMVCDTSAMVGPSKLRQFASPYFAVWNSDRVYIYDRCMNQLPKISAVNLYLALANETTLPNALNFLIINEVLKRFQATPRVPDQIDDQNNTR